MQNSGRHATRAMTESGPDASMTRPMSSQNGIDSRATVVAAGSPGISGSGTRSAYVAGDRTDRAGGERERSAQVEWGEVGVIGEDLSLVTTRSQLAEHRRDRNTGAGDARLPGHHLRMKTDARMGRGGHGVNNTSPTRSVPECTNRE